MSCAVLRTWAEEREGDQNKAWPWSPRPSSLSVLN